MKTRLMGIACILLAGISGSPAGIAGLIGRRCCGKGTPPTAARRFHSGGGVSMEQAGESLHNRSRASSRHLTWRPPNIEWPWRRTRSAPRLAREAEQSYRCCVEPGSPRRA